MARSEAREITFEDYRDKLTIDRDDLESCLVEHAQLFWEISSQAVTANAWRDEAKLNMEQLHAQLDGETREELAKGDGKVTEAQVTNAIKSNPKMQKALGKLQDAKTQADQWSALKEAFYQRGYMLRELVQLTLRSMAADSEVAGLERTADTLRKGTGSRASDRQREKYSKTMGKPAKKARR